MIRSFKSKKLRELFVKGIVKGIRPDHLRRVELILGRLNTAKQIKDMNLPGLRLHQLKGQFSEYYAAHVNGNWRVIFKFDGEDFFDLDYIDYH